MTKFILLKKYILQDAEVFSSVSMNETANPMSGVSTLSDIFEAAGMLIVIL